MELTEKYQKLLIDLFNIAKQVDTDLRRIIGSIEKELCAFPAVWCKPGEHVRSCPLGPKGDEPVQPPYDPTKIHDAYEDDDDEPPSLLTNLFP